MTNLIPASATVAFSKAMQDIVDSFFKMEVIINHRTVVTDVYGEEPVVTFEEFAFQGIYQYAVGQGGRYHTVERSDIGQIFTDGWKVFLYKSDVDAKLVVDPEADSAIINGKEYEIRMWSPTGSWSTLPFQFYEFEVHFDAGA